MHEVQDELEALGDPDAASPLPSGSLSAFRAATRPLQSRASTDESPRGVTAEILRLAWPVMLTQVLMNLAGLIDRMMIGRLSGDDGAAVPLAAVGYATQFFFLIQSTLFAVGLACVALMARAIGARRPDRARDVLAASLQVSILVTALFTLIMWFGGRTILGALGAEPIVINESIPYLNLLLTASLVLAVSLVFDSALRANRNTRTPMVIAMFVTIAKLFGNWVLIFGNLGFGAMGLYGAGLATAISQVIGLACYLAFLSRQPAASPLKVRIADLFRRNDLTRQVVQVAVPGIAERMVMNFALLAYFWVLSQYYGTVAVAAYTVGIALLSFSWIPGTGYAQACATLVGQALGARKPPLAKRAGLSSVTLAIGTAIPLSILCGVYRYPLARLFTDDATVIAALGPFMLALAIGQPLLQLHFTLGGAHRGAGDTVTPLVAATIGNWLFRIPLALLFSAGLGWDVVWVWYALIFDHAARAIWLGVSFRRGGWLTRLKTSD